MRILTKGTCRQAFVPLFFKQDDKINMKGNV